MLLQISVLRALYHSFFISGGIEVAEENYPEHGYTANALNLQDTAVPVPR